MPYVPLDRNFVPMSKDAEPSLDITPDIGRKYAGWLGWSQLLDRRRVVVLAEASSGKTTEFQHAAVELCARGEPAFFATIERLAEDGLTSSLGHTEVALLERWRAGVGDAWFFRSSPESVTGPVRMRGRK